MKQTDQGIREAEQRTQWVLTLNVVAAVITFVLGTALLFTSSSLLLAIASFALCGLCAFNAVHLKKEVGLLRDHREMRIRVEEKETLLKEVHHRVKNNLQTVSSLLNLQSRSIEDPQVTSAIKSSQNRVVSMAMVHEMLYQRDHNLSKIHLAPYIEELCGYLIRSIKGDAPQIELELDIAPTRMSVDTVIPLGLIINETVTNSLKYGIPEDRPGRLTIRMERKGDGCYEMYVADDGIGFPDGFDPEASKSLGLRLIEKLARQLKGRIERLDEGTGTNYRLSFKEIQETAL